MNLLLVTNLFPTLHDPERGIFTLQLAKRLQAHCNVTVVCPLPWFPDWKIFKKFKKWQQYSRVKISYEIEGIHVLSPKYFVIPKISERFHALLMFISISHYIKNLHKHIHFDLINSHWLYPDSVAMDKIASSLNIPHVPTGLGSDINRELYDHNKKEQILTMLQRSSAITVVSNNLKIELIKHHIRKDKITTIPNGIDTEKFKILDKSKCRNILNIHNDAPFILYVGRLSQEKSIPTLIDAAHNVIRLKNKLNVYIVGEGAEYSKIVEQINSLGENNNITLVGKVNHNEISTWMGAADYICLPSIMEGCPNVILEALGCGRPVIASKVGAIPDIVTSESGILFEAENTEELTKSILKALKNNWRHDIIKQSVQYLSWEHAAEKYFNVFKSAISNPNNK